MERFILPMFAVFGFFSSLFMDGGRESGVAKVTQTNKAQVEYD